MAWSLPTICMICIPSETLLEQTFFLSELLLVEYSFWTGNWDLYSLPLVFTSSFNTGTVFGSDRWRHHACDYCFCELLCVSVNPTVSRRPYSLMNSILSPFTCFLLPLLKSFLTSEWRDLVTA